MISAIRGWASRLAPRILPAKPGASIPAHPWIGMAALITLPLCACATPSQAPSEPVNGCDPATATDYSRASEVEIRFGDEYAHEYVPKCLTVSAGTRIHFRGNFATHPLASGRFAAGLYEDEAGSPVQRSESGEEATFVFPEAGAFGFICYIHVVNGMMGAVFVE